MAAVVTPGIRSMSYRFNNYKNLEFRNDNLTGQSLVHFSMKHLDEFALINMNGRVYDPVLGRFLSPDPYVQLPDYSQSYNRYSYCFNNPMIYTDPSGLRTFYGERGYDGESDGKMNRKLDCDGTGGFITFMDAWREAVDKGYAGSCAEFRELYDRQVNKPNFNGTITLQTGWMDYFSQGIVYGEKGPLGSYINSEPTFSTIRVDYFGGNPPNVVPGGGGNQPGGNITGSSFDATISAGSGYGIEAGFYLSADGKNAEQFLSHGLAVGNELSAGWNFIFIKTKEKFSFNDLEGNGVSFVYNFGLISISIFGNSAPRFPENSIFESYYGVKIGIGAGFGGSYSPSSKTSFINFDFPDISKSFFHWR